MASSEQREDEKWDNLTASIDLLFAKVGAMDRTQQQISAQLDLSAQVMERMIQDQQTLAKQVDATGQAVARLTLNRQQMHPPSPRPIHREDQSRGFEQGEFSRAHEDRSPRPPPVSHRVSTDSHSFSRHALPKMSFPRFTGANPTIWKDKCLDYFRIFNIPEVYWVTAASMHMDDNASKWLQMHKLTHDLDSWTEFISAVEDHFGSYDYRDAIGELVSLTQDGTLEDYISAFVDLQYQVTMHNTGFDQVYFVTQFIKGLKHELRMGVQSQVPQDMKRAIMLAKVQQQVLESKQFKTSRYSPTSKSSATSSSSRFDTKSTSSAHSSLWKERQLRDFRKSSGLCMYCGDKYDAAHAASCTKRPQGQVHTLVLNDLDQPLSVEVLTQLAMEDSVTDELQHLSLNALAGTAHGEVLQLRGMLQNKAMVVLLDSGSSHSFVNASFLAKVGISPISVPPKQVKVANGQCLVTDKLVPAMEWWCQGHTMVTDMQVTLW